MVLLTSLAALADPIPTMPGDPLRPDPGSSDSIAAPALRAPLGLHGNTTLSYAHQLVYQQDDDQTLRSVLGGAAALHIGASLGGERGDLTVQVPAYVALYGDLLSAPGGAIGDLALGLRAGMTPWLSGLLYATVPTGDATRLAGYGQLTASVGLVAGVQTLRVSSRYQVTPSVSLGGQEFNDVLHLSTVWAPPLTGTWSASAELLGQRRLRAVRGGSNTAELLVLGHRGALSVGAGMGLLGGAGTPTWRLVVRLRGTPPPPS